MPRIEVFTVQSTPTTREKKGLPEMVKDFVNAWFDKNPDIRNPIVSISPELQAKFPSALVLIQYEAPEKSSAKPTK